MQIVKDYRDKKVLRDSFNELAKKVFDLDFEGWYRNGFWNENYIPYSVVIDGKVVANVSVNRCDMRYNGSVLKLIQLGTVMTDPDYRGKGYARILMEKIMQEYEDRTDGMFLYANDSVLAFYPKFGFYEKAEYQYSKPVKNTTGDVTKKVPMDTVDDWAKMVDVMKSKAQCGNMTMCGNEDLLMFYLSQFMRECVYYIGQSDTYVIAEIEGDTLMIHAIFGEASVDDVIASFGSAIRRAILFFTPTDRMGYEETVVDEEDTTLFVKGKAFETIGDDKFMFQAIAHA